MGAELDQDDWNWILSHIGEVGPRALELMTHDFDAEAVQLANIKTGDLRSSIQEGEQQISDYQWIVGTNLQYAPYVHEGTPPHDIYPIGQPSYLGRTIRTGEIQESGEPAKALYWPGAPHPVKVVHHPGYAGNPFFDDAGKIVEDRTEEYLEMAMVDLQ